jgi:hypothetical protein
MLLGFEFEGAEKVTYYVSCPIRERIRPRLGMRNIPSAPLRIHKVMEVAGSIPLDDRPIYVK